MTPKISVIIPIFNAQNYLRECLDSVVNQSLRDIEIICVDDGSTDETPAILREYEENDSRVRVIFQQNKGAGAARNNALQYATGEYLSILDCDDFFELNMLEKSYQAAVENNLDILVFGCDFYYDDTQTYHDCNHSINRRILPNKKVFSANDVQQDVFRLFVGWTWDKLFRTAFVKEHGLTFQEQRTTNDLLFVFNGLLRAERISVLEGIYAHYRRSSESLSVTREKSWMCFYNALIALREEMYKIGCYERFEQDYKNYCINFSLWHLNTLKEPTHTLLYNKLRDEWFEEMGLLEHSKEYFYHPHEYATFRRVYENPISSYKKNTIPVETGNAISRGIQCCRDHGISYTIKYFFHKLLNKLKKH